MVELTPEEQAAAERLDERTAGIGGPRPRYFDLDGNPISLGTWAVMFERRDNTRFIGKDEVGDARVSTVWLGLDHGSVLPDDPPELFETMIFGGKYDEEMWRWPTQDAARAGHERIVAALKAGDAPEGVDHDCRFDLLLCRQP